MANLKHSAVSSLLNGIFAIAMTKYHDRHVAWTNLSGLLAGQFSLPIAMISLQSQGHLDLLLCCIEDEFKGNEASIRTGNIGFDLVPHYQRMLSESWIISCYEILRAFRQRDRESKLGSDGVSSLSSFKALITDQEFLRMPIAKYEIAKDAQMKQPLHFVRNPPNNDATDQLVYDKDDPARSYLLQAGWSERGSVTWLALDHTGPREYWIERRDLADQLLALRDEVVPAGILEAQRAAARSDAT